jgi:hypothetical protein
MKTIKEEATVNYLGFDFDLKGNYFPGSWQTYDYPGSDAEFEITEVTLNGIDAEELINRLDAWDELAELAVEYITN